MTNEEHLEEIMAKVKYVEVDGEVYVNRLDLLDCCNHIENDIVRIDSITTVGSLLRWLRTNLTKVGRE